MFLARFYYLLKPFIPRRLRVAIRRVHATRILRNCGDTWPINKSAGEKPEGWPGWPEGKQFALVLTHDVESQIGLKRVRQLAELNMRLDVRSSFNFIPEGPYRVSKDLLQWLLKNGFEVGVHDLHHDGKLYRDRAEFVRRSKLINHYLADWGAKGFRSGFMLNELDWLHDLNIQYDASTFDTDPFEPQPEGRHTIFPFWLPRVKNANSRPESSESSHNGYVELPYTLPQDFMLFLILKEWSVRIWQKKLDWIAECGGMALVIVHPDYIEFRDKSSTLTYPAALYSGFLTWLKQKYAGKYWNALPAEVAELVRRSQPKSKPTVTDVSGGRRHHAHRMAKAAIRKRED